MGPSRARGTCLSSARHSRRATHTLPVHSLEWTMAIKLADSTDCRQIPVISSPPRGELQAGAFSLFNFISPLKRKNSRFDGFDFLDTGKRNFLREEMEDSSSFALVGSKARGRSFQNAAWGS